MDGLKSLFLVEDREMTCTGNSSFGSVSFSTLAYAKNAERKVQKARIFILNRHLTEVDVVSITATLLPAAYYEMKEEVCVS